MKLEEEKFYFSLYFEVTVKYLENSDKVLKAET